MNSPIEQAWMRGVDHCNTLVQETIPTDHYFHTFAALGNIHAYMATRNETYWEKAKTFIQTYVRLSPKGHHEFNELALRLILEKKDQLPMDTTFWETTQTALQLARPRKKIGDNVSVNWLVMGLYTRALAGEQDEETRQLGERLQTIQLGDGALVDYPLNHTPDRRATPLTYHAKMAFWLSRIGTMTPDPTFTRMGEHAAGYLAHFIHRQSNGMVFGRTPESVFGVLHAYLLFASEYHRTHHPLMGACAALEEKHLLSFQQPDGQFTPTPHFSPTHPTLDFYIHAPVYHAYVTALLGAFPFPPIPTHPLPDESFYGKESGLLSVRKGDFFLAMNVNGQHAPGQSSFFSDSRYNGMSPLFMADGNNILIPVPPLPPAGKNPYDPSTNGFALSLQRGGHTYSVPTFDHPIVEWEKDSVHIVGNGSLREMKNTHSLFSLPRRAWGYLTRRTPDGLGPPTPVRAHAQIDINWKEKKMSISFEPPEGYTLESGARFMHENQFTHVSVDMIPIHTHEGTADPPVGRTSQPSWEWTWS